MASFKKTFRFIDSILDQIYKNQICSECYYVGIKNLIFYYISRKYIIIYIKVALNPNFMSSLFLMLSMTTPPTNCSHLIALHCRCNILSDSVSTNHNSSLPGLFFQDFHDFGNVEYHNQARRSCLEIKMQMGLSQTLVCQLHKFTAPMDDSSLLYIVYKCILYTWN